MKHKNTVMPSWTRSVLFALAVLGGFSAQSAPAATAPPINKKVLHVIYDPTLANGQRLSAARGWYSPETMLPQVLNSIRVNSGGVVNYTVVQTTLRNEWPLKLDGYRYNETAYNTCMNAPIEQRNTLCHMPDEADYARVFADLNVCSRISAGEFDEVMIFAFPYSGFDEFAFKIPGDVIPFNKPVDAWHYDLRKKNIPDCSGKTVWVMGFNYERDLPEAVHSYGHRTETAITLNVGRGYWGGCGGGPLGVSQFDDFTCIASEANPGSAVTVAGCGNVHYPVNGTTRHSVFGYDYNNTTVVPHSCNSWNNYPFTQKTVVNEGCTAWGCNPTQPYWATVNQLNYLEYWMRHIPKVTGTGPRGALNNWWAYVADFDNAVRTVGPVNSGTAATCNPHNFDQVGCDATPGCSYDQFVNMCNPRGPLPAAACSPTITPYIKIGSGAFVNTDTVTIPASASITFGPQPTSGGSWNWTGPSGFTSTTRQITRTISTTSVYTARYTNASGCVSTRAFTVNVVPSTTATQINSGGNAASPYAADAGFSGGSTASTTSTINTSLLSSPLPPQAVLKDWRQGTSTITYTVTGFTPGIGKVVSLLFSENTFTAANQRKFNVVVNGVTVLSNFDIYANTGARYKAIQQNFSVVSNASGQFVIQLVPVTGQAMINGIKIQ